MKQLTVLMLAFVFVTTTAFAKSDESTAISGNYAGEISSKTFFENSGSAKLKSNNRYEVDLTLSNDVFILQSPNVKCMGSFKVEGEFLILEMTTSKGNAALAEKLCTQQYKISTSGEKLMLISDQSVTSDLIIFNLTKKAS